jgi:hypothetical protein
MAKKQTRRSISVSRTTYERLKAFCETNNISMSQLVETRVNDFLGNEPAIPNGTLVPSQPGLARPTLAGSSSSGSLATGGSSGSGGSLRGGPMSSAATGGISPSRAGTEPSSTPGTGAASAGGPRPVVPMTSAAARFAVDPPPPIIKPKQETTAPKPAEKRPDQIFTF